MDYEIMHVEICFYDSDPVVLQSFIFHKFVLCVLSLSDVKIYYLAAC